VTDHDFDIDIDEPSAEFTDDELVDDEMSEQDRNGHLLSIRRADGSEVVSLSTLGSGEPWSVYLQPGGGIRNAYLGSQDSPIVWLNTDDSEVGRDEDGTYYVVV
jgi:hypothetical protein